MPIFRGPVSDPNSAVRRMPANAQVQGRVRFSLEGWVRVTLSDSDPAKDGLRSQMHGPGTWGGRTVPRPEASAAAAYLQTFGVADDGFWVVAAWVETSGGGGGALPRTVTETSVVAVAPSSSMTVSVNA